jgi:CRP-like cAMP-binding protein
MHSKSKLKPAGSSGSPGDVLRYLRTAIVFRNLSDSELAPFVAAAQVQDYRKGAIVYREEDPSNSIYIICEGWVKIFHTLPNGLEVVVEMMTRNRIISAFAALEHAPQDTTAEVVEDTRLVRIPRALLEQQIRLNPKLTENIILYLSSAHRRHRTEVALSFARTAPERVGHFFLKLCPPGKKKDVVFYLPYDKAIIASTLGMTRGSFSRALNVLRQKTSIRIVGQRVEIDSIARLGKFVYGSTDVRFAPIEL